MLAQQLARRLGIEVFYDSPVKELLTNEAGSVVGVVVETAAGRRQIAAHAVVLATGSFEHDAQMLRQHMPLNEVFAIGPLTHTGDGVGWRSRPAPGSGTCGWNEYPPAVQDTPIRPLEYYDADLQRFPRLPCYLVFDEEGRALEPIGRTMASSSAVEFTWSRDNRREIESGVICQADPLPSLAERISVDPQQLLATVGDWNRTCESRGDPEFHRPMETMMAIRTPPYYAVPAWPLVSNTQDGPVHDAQQQVLDSFGEPIPGLCAAGELGSIFGHLYLLGRNLSECFIGGQIADRVAAERSKG